MQITPNSPIRRPIIRFLLAVRRKKGSAPVISTDFHPVQRLPSLDLSFPPFPLSPRERDVTGHRSTEISPSRIGDFFFGGSSYRCVHLRPHERPFETVNCIREGFFASPLHTGAGGEERKHGGYTRSVTPPPSVSRKLCATLAPDFLRHTKWLLGLAGRYRCDPHRFEEFRISGTVDPPGEIQGGQGVYTSSVITFGKVIAWVEGNTVVLIK